MENNNPIPINSNKDVGKDSDDEYFKRIPPGCRFVPTDEELIVHYLIPQINNQKLPRNRINIVNLYGWTPEILASSADKYELSKKNECYFFTSRNRKYQGGTRPNRAAGNGFWKATDADKIVVHNGETVGYRKTLVYHTGKSPNDTKTDWIMHEYRVKNSPAPIQRTENIWRLDDCVLCKLYKKAISSRNRNKRKEANNNAEEVVEGEIENPTPINSSVALDEPMAMAQNIYGSLQPQLLNELALGEPMAHNEAAAQTIHGSLQPQLLINELPSMTISSSGESSLIYDDSILSTLVDDRVGMINGPNNDFGVPLDVGPLMSSEPQDPILRNGISTQGCSQYSMNQMPMLSFERHQHGETHELLSVNGSSTHDIGGFYQYPVNPVPRVIARSPYETLQVNGSWTHDIGSSCHPQYPMNNVPTSIFNCQPDETPRAHENWRQNMNYIHMQIPNRHHDQTSITSRGNNDWRHEIGGSSHCTMGQTPTPISNPQLDELHKINRTNSRWQH